MSQEHRTSLSRRKFLALISASSLTSLVTAACGGAQNAGTQPTAAGSGAEATAAPVGATSAPAAQTTAPAAQATAPAASGEVVNLRYVFPGAPQKDMVMVQEALSALAQQKGLNANITLESIDFGAYNEKINLMNTGGEKFDLVFTAPWINNYYQNVNNGTLRPLDNLLPKYAPNLWASMPETTWEAARVNGNIYGVINQQIFPKRFGPTIRKDLVDKYKIDMSSITSYEQLTAIMQQIKDGEPDLRYVYLGDSGSNLEIWGYDPIDQALGFPGVKFDDANTKVINFYEAPESTIFATLVKTWRAAGFTAIDELKQEEVDALYKDGQVAMIVSGVVKPGGELEMKNKFGYEWVSQPVAPNYLTTGGVVATLNAIPATSEHPEAAMQLLELLNTDPDVYNLIAKGIEDTHWKFVDPDKKVIEIIDPDTSGYNPNSDWKFGNQFNAYYTDPAAVGNWEKTKEINDSAKPSPILGFTCDRTPVETELAQLSEVGTRVLKPVFTGEGDVAANLKAANDEMKAAGVDTVIAELQKQIDAWKATRGG
jgi:putative aldouronate transport system substrate-binding protein